jgi:LysM domain
VVTMGGAPELAARRPVMRRPGARRPGRVRLTRRGRAVVLVLLLVVAGLGVALAASASRAAAPSGPAPTAVVRPGDTLWSVAERHVPATDPFVAIEEIRRLNGLSGYTIHPCQTLTLPDVP